MPSARNTIVIGRPVADVFAFVADGTTATRWRPGVLDVALCRAPGLARGPVLGGAEVGSLAMLKGVMESAL